MHVAQSLATLRLDHTATTPLFRQLYKGIRQAILDGRLAPGVQLPPTRALALQFGISRQTVLNAYAQLNAEGYLDGSTGRGTFVSAALPLTRKRADAAPPPTPALRPLSVRGQSFTGARVALNVHDAGRPLAFRIGMPGLDLFPFDVWARLEARCRRQRPHHHGYGDPAGYRPLREALALYLRTSRGVRCEPDQILITSGSQQALYLIVTLLLESGDAAWVEEPGYRGIIATLHAAQARICPVPVDAAGLCVSEGAARHPQAKLIYTTPSHQLPLGITMSLARRLELLDWAARNKAWVVEDDYDSEYRYTGPPLASLQSLDRYGCVLYVGTLSKVLFPDLRLGYLVLPPALVEPFTRARALIDRHASIAPQIVLTEFINAGHFSRHIKRTRKIYGERRAALLHELEGGLAKYLTVGAADAGLQLTTCLRAGANDQEIAHEAAARGLEVRALSSFYNARESERMAGLVLGFAPFTAQEIQAGARALRALLAFPERPGRAT